MPKTKEIKYDKNYPMDFSLARNEPKEKLKNNEITYLRSLFNAVNVGTLLDAGNSSLPQKFNF
jgi:hypothetical protein